MSNIREFNLLVGVFFIACLSGCLAEDVSTETPPSTQFLLSAVIHPIDENTTAVPWHEIETNLKTDAVVALFDQVMEEGSVRSSFYKDGSEFWLFHKYVLNSGGSLWVEYEGVEVELSVNELSH